MLRYEWNHNNNNHNNHSPPPPNLILSDIDLHHHHHHHHNHHDYFSNANPSSTTSTLSNPHHRPIFDDPFSNPYTFTHDNTPPPHSHPQHHHQLPIFGNNNNNNTNNNNININDNNNNSFNFPPQPCSSSFLTLESLSSVMQIPKTEQVGGDHHHHQFFSSHPIGLNLGRRTYFSADDDLVSRLYRRSRVAEPAIHSPKCQAEGCSADLSHAKHYHRRHKVCEFHSKASTVIAAGLTQRFCQQCSRFHLLSEFDNGKRSCRKRLADHNRRRRKSNNQRSTSTAPPSFSSDNPQTSPSQHILRSPSDSGLNSSSSVTIAISPPRVSFDSNFMQRSYD